MKTDEQLADESGLPHITIDQAGKVRCAHITFKGRTESERIPLHTFKLPPDKMEWELKETIRRLKTAFKKKYNITLPPECA